MEKPIAWMYELATHRNTETGEYTHWGPAKITFHKPCVPAGSIRNLRPLYPGDIEA